MELKNFVKMWGISMLMKSANSKSEYPHRVDIDDYLTLNQQYSWVLKNTTGQFSLYVDRWEFENFDDAVQFSLTSF